MSKKERIGLWLIVGVASAALAVIMSPWSLLACFGCFGISVAVSMHKDEEKRDEADA